MLRALVILSAVAAAYTIFADSYGYTFEAAFLVLPAIALAAVGMAPRDAARMGAAAGLATMVMFYIIGPTFVIATGIQSPGSDDGTSTAPAVLFAMFVAFLCLPAAVIGALTGAASAALTRAFPPFPEPRH